VCGEDAPRPYPENLIAPEIKTNKQIKITLDTQQRRLTNQIQYKRGFSLQQVQEEKTHSASMMRRKTSFYLCRLTHWEPHFISHCYRQCFCEREELHPKPRERGPLQRRHRECRHNSRANLVQYAKSQLGFCSLLSRTPCVVPARIIGREMAIERAHTRWSLATNGRIGERSVMLPAALKVHA